MRIKIITLLAGILLPPLAAQASPPLTYLTFGPTLHWNFKEGGFTAFSYGFEAALWRFGQDPTDGTGIINLPRLQLPGHGLALGIEFDRKAIRIHAEPQVGAVLAGASMGPVLELDREGGRARFGIQASAWANYFGGADFRYRRLGGENHQSVGLFAKLPALVAGTIDTSDK